MAPPAERAESDVGTLFLVPTPIGNPRDITMRAQDVLASVAVVAAEDTRHARTLLTARKIQAKLVSYYDFNERSRSEQLLRTLQDGEDVAVITDAGMPLINDPGYRIVTAAISAGVPVRPLPGACAAVTALIGSGLPSHSFAYFGYLPRKSAARRALIASLTSLDVTMIFYEAPHRLEACLDDLHGVLGDRAAALARNLTKHDEEYLRGPVSALRAELRDRGDVRGEYTILVEGTAKEEIGENDALAALLARALLKQGLQPRAIREVVKEVTELSRNRVYEHVQLARETTPLGPPSGRL